jgi:hypothetical protein
VAFKFSAWANAVEDNNKTVAIILEKEILSLIIFVSSLPI